MLHVSQVSKASGLFYGAPTSIMVGSRIRIIIQKELKSSNHL